MYNGGFARGGGGGGSTVSVPNSCLGLIIGRGGAKVQELNAKYGVKVNVPPKGQQNGVVETLEITGSGNIQGCVQEIESIVASADSRPAPSMGMGGMGGMAAGGAIIGVGGIGGAAGGGAAGAGGRMRAVGVVFRTHPVTGELQTLLEYVGNRWTFVTGSLSQLGDEGDAYRNGMKRILMLHCGLDHGHVENLRFLPPINLPTKSIHHVIVPPTPEWGQWQPGPATQCEVQVPPTSTVIINGEPLHAMQGHVWVDTALLHAGKDALNEKEINQWFEKNHTVVNEVLAVYSGAAKVTMRSTVPAAAGAAAAAGGGAASDVDPNWVSTPAGLKVVQNLRALAQFMVTLSDDHMVELARVAFNPNELMTVYRKLEAQHFDKLPHRSQNIG